MPIVRLHSDARMSQAVIHNGVIYLAGQVGAPGEDVGAQTHAVLKQIDRLLAEAGTTRATLLSATIWLTDMRDFEAMNRVWDEWIGGENPPTRATGEARLASDDYRVEIIVTAATAAA